MRCSVCLCALVLLSACSSPELPTHPQVAPLTTASPSLAMAEARELYNGRCLNCHGAQGRGDGPDAVLLDPRPSDFSQARWQQSVTDDYLTHVILGGSQVIGKGPAMPANPDLRAKPAVVQALCAIIRAFGQSPAQE